MLWRGLFLGALLLGGGACSALVPSSPTPTPRAPSATFPPAPLTPAPQVRGDAARGRLLFVTTGCAGCHTLRGLDTATGVAGPNLTNVVLRPTMANDAFATTPENLTRWLLEPSALKPGTAMPGVGLTEEEAWDLTAFLYSQPFNPGR